MNQISISDREQLQLGSLSHYINSRAAGYRELPPFASEPTPNTLREVETVIETTKGKPKLKQVLR